MEPIPLFVVENSASEFEKKVLAKAESSDSETVLLLPFHTQQRGEASLANISWTQFFGASSRCPSLAIGLLLTHVSLVASRLAPSAAHMNAPTYAHTMEQAHMHHSFL